jgi:hypothetical protein
VAANFEYNGQGIVHRLYCFRTPYKRIKFKFVCDGWYLHLQIVLILWEMGMDIYLRRQRRMRGA